MKKQLLFLMFGISVLAYPPLLNAQEFFENDIKISSDPNKKAVFSEAQKSDYQKQMDDLLDSASKYVNISNEQRNFYKKYMNKNLIEMEKNLNEMPEAYRPMMMNGFDDFFRKQAEIMNNPQISASQKKELAKQLLQEIEERQQDELEEQKQQALEKKKAEEEAKEAERQRKLEEEKLRKQAEEESRKQVRAQKSKEEIAGSVQFHSYWTPANLEDSSIKWAKKYCESKGGKLPSREEILEVMSKIYGTKLELDKSYAPKCNIRPDDLPCGGEVLENPYIDELIDPCISKEFKKIIQQHPILKGKVRASVTIPSTYITPHSSKNFMGHIYRYSITNNSLTPIPVGVGENYACVMCIK